MTGDIPYEVRWASRTNRCFATPPALLIAAAAQQHGGVISHQILTGHGADIHGVILGALFFILGFGGFESATALGGEARAPRRSGPLVVVASALIVAGFFVLNAYVQVLGFQGTGSSLADQAFPLASLGTEYHVAWLATIVALGVAVSFFSASGSACRRAMSAWSSSPGS